MISHAGLQAQICFLVMHPVRAVSYVQRKDLTVGMLETVLGTIAVR